MPYNPDVTGDGKVTIADSVAIGLHFGETIIKPGTGFVDSPTGYNTEIVAGWNIAQNSDFGDFGYPGVMVENSVGVLKVEFSCNGSPWVSISKRPFLNTGVPCYWPTIIGSGIIEVRCRITPTVGAVKILEGMLMFGTEGLASRVKYVAVDGDDTAPGTETSPLATMGRAAYLIMQEQGNTDGGVIKLYKGGHIMAASQWWDQTRADNRWLTVEGTDAEIIKNASPDSSGFNNALVKFKNLTIRQMPNGGGNMFDSVWFDQCAFKGCGCGTGSFDRLFVTNSTFEDLNEVIFGAKLVSKVKISRAGGDCLVNVKLVDDVLIENLTQAAGSHTNMWQELGTATDVLLSRIRGKGPVQAFQANGAIDGLAIVDCDIEATYPLAVGGGPRNMYHKRCNLKGTVLDYGVSGAVNCLMEKVTQNGLGCNDAGYKKFAGFTYVA